jgi:urease accessory protein
MVRVIAAPQTVLRITTAAHTARLPDLTRAAYHLGNRVRRSSSSRPPEIEPDHVLADLLRSLAHLIVKQVDEPSSPRAAPHTQGHAYGDPGAARATRLPWPPSRIARPLQPRP